MAILFAACLVSAQTLVWEGTWSSSTPYTAGQVVSYLGGTYICITGNTNVPPPTSTVDWTALAQSGATVSVGTTVTGAPLTNAAVTNVGTSKNAVLNFTIPQGYISGGGGGIPWPTNAGLAAYSGASSWRAPTYSDVTALWAGGTCSGYLSSNGTCSTTLGFLPVNNPTFTGNLSGPTASITSLTTAGIVTNTASGVLGTATGTNGYYSLWNSLGNLSNGHLDDGVTTAGTITSTEPLAGTSATFSGAVTAPAIRSGNWVQISCSNDVATDAETIQNAINSNAAYIVNVGGTCNLGSTPITMGTNTTTSDGEIIFTSGAPKVLDFGGQEIIYSGTGAAIQGSQLRFTWVRNFTYIYTDSAAVPVIHFQDAVDSEISNVFVYGNVVGQQIFLIDVVNTNWGSLHDFIKDTRIASGIISFHGTPTFALTTSGVDDTYGGIYDIQNAFEMTFINATSEIASSSYPCGFCISNSSGNFIIYSDVEGDYTNPISVTNSTIQLSGSINLIGYAGSGQPVASSGSTITSGCLSTSNSIYGNLCWGNYPQPLNLTTQTGYNSPSNSTITIGASNSSAVDNGNNYSYTLATSGNASGQILTLSNNVRSGSSTNVLSIQGTAVTTGVLRSSSITATAIASSGAPTGTPTTGTGSVTAGTYYAKVVSVDGNGNTTTGGTESAAVTLSGTGEIAWSWTAVTGAASYQLWVGTASGSENTYVAVSGTSYTQTAALTSGTMPTVNTTGSGVFAGPVTAGPVYQFTVGTTAIGANSCTTAATISMPSVTTSSVFVITPSSSSAGITGWGSSGGLIIDAWPTAGTFNWSVCNQSGVSVTPSASLTFNVKPL